MKKDKKIMLTIVSVLSIFLMLSMVTTVPASNGSAIEKILKEKKTINTSKIKSGYQPTGPLENFSLLGLLKKIKAFLEKLDIAIDAIIQIIDILIELIENLQDNPKIE